MNQMYLYQQGLPHLSQKFLMNLMNLNHLIHLMTPMCQILVYLKNPKYH
jgi:hypothetical protein